MASQAIRPATDMQSSLPTDERRLGNSCIRSPCVHVDTHGFGRLTATSETPHLAKQVRRIMLSQYDNISGNELIAAEKDAASSELSRRKRRDAQDFVRRANLEQDDKDFINRSGLAGIALTAAFRLLPHLQEICIPYERTDRDDQRHTDFSATRAFSLICACLPSSETKLQKLDILFWEADTSRAISLQALCFPRQALACFSELRVLKLLLQTKNGNHYRNPDQWKTSASNFLANCPQLCELSLGFTNDWNETAIVFNHIARKVILPNLKKFKLDFLRCQGEDLLRFLSNHEYLRAVSLHNLDIIGSVAYSAILNHLQHHHRSLEWFSCKQIAENSFRTFFGIHGRVEFDRSPTARLIPGSETEPYFFDDFVAVTRPRKYDGEAVYWEGVQHKIGILKDDLHISDLRCTSDLAVYDIDRYQWSKAP